MINRVLIRIKVVQLLYSYLLVENQFSLESQPSAPTKEKRFAYSLYLDMLMLMIRISQNVEKRGGVYPLKDTRFILRVLSDEKIKSLQAKYRLSDFPFGKVVASLADVVKESAIYKNFLKSEERGSMAEKNVWKELFEKVIMADPDVNSLIALRENYTIKGVDRMRDMMDQTLSQFFASGDRLPDALATLETSLRKARELYFRLLTLPIAITDMRERDIDDARHKYIRSDEDINPNLRFVENAFVESLRNNELIAGYVKENKLAWMPSEEPMVRSLLRTIMQSDIYADYMDFPATDYYTDAEFWRNVYRHIIFINPDFLESLEDMSVFWNDDLDFIGTFLLKTVKRFQQYESMDPEQRRHADNPVLPMYKDDEDAAFGRQLFEEVITKKEMYRHIIDETIDRSMWEFDRLAYMDVVVTMTALAEIMNFPKIPLTVTFNEYVEIAKCYSTPKSGNFVNGLLGSIVDKLIEESRIAKRF